MLQPVTVNIPDNRLFFVVTFEQRADQFAALWRLKNSSRRNLKNWLLALNMPTAVADAWASACSELFENCIRYASEVSRATILVSLTDRDVTIETVNRSDVTHKTVLGALLVMFDQVGGDVRRLWLDQFAHPVNGAIHLGLITSVMETQGRLQLLPEQADDVVHMRLQARL